MYLSLPTIFQNVNFFTVCKLKLLNNNILFIELSIQREVWGHYDSNTSDFLTLWGHFFGPHEKTAYKSYRMIFFENLKMHTVLYER